MTPLACPLQDRHDILRERGCGPKRRLLRVEAGRGGEDDGAEQGDRRTRWFHLGEFESRYPYPTRFVRHAWMTQLTPISAVYDRKITVSITVVTGRDIACALCRHVR